MQAARAFVITGLFSLAVVLVWMNRYEYDEHIPYHVVRINRFSGQLCYSQPDGTWNSKLNPPDKSSLAAQSLGSENKQESNPFSLSATLDQERALNNLCD